MHNIAKKITSASINTENKIQSTIGQKDFFLYSIYLFTKEFPI
jgi:hypothetical protein